jgi:hypothetical protein
MVKRTYIQDYDWVAIQSAYDAGVGWRELAAMFGTSAKSLSKASLLGLFKPRTQSEAQKVEQTLNPRTHSEYTRKIMSEHARRRGLGGTRNSTRFKYQTKSGEIVTLDSSYEIKVAESLDENNIDLDKTFPYILDRR